VRHVLIITFDHSELQTVWCEIGERSKLWTNVVLATCSFWT